MRCKHAMFAFQVCNVLRFKHAVLLRCNRALLLHYNSAMFCVAIVQFLRHKRKDYEMPLLHKSNFSVSCNFLPCHKSQYSQAMIISHLLHI